MPVSRRTVLQATSTLPLLGAFGLGHAQQGAPFEQVKVVTGFPPGGTSDTICRRVAAKLAPGYGKSVVVENRTGAGGQIAVQSMRQSPNDGSVILQTPMSMLGIYPHIYKKLPYDPVADVVPVSLGCTFDFGFAVGPSVPASVKTMEEFLAWCKANPNQANFGSPGAGAMPHFIGELAAKARGEVTAEVTSAAPLSADQAKALAETLKGKIGKTVTLNQFVDPSLIGGLQVKVGSQMIDSSLKTKLAAMKIAMKEVG